VVEIHINHPYNDRSIQLLDRHLAITENDLPLLEWTLERTPHLQAVTLESDFPGETGVLGQIGLLRRVTG
jgi:hypothetical protein